MSSINIKEVAKTAGVSVATISRVLNHPEQVQPETRNHVLEVMRQLDYQPNWFARGLNIGKTGTIALLIPSIEDHGFLDVVTGVETIARRKEHTVLIWATGRSRCCWITGLRWRLTPSQPDTGTP